MKQREPTWFTHLLAYGGLVILVFVTYAAYPQLYAAYQLRELGISDETKMLLIILTTVYAVVVPNIIWATRKIYESEDDNMSGPLDDKL